MVLSNHCLLLICAFLSVGYGRNDLNLKEGDPCVSNGVNGTCVDVLKCNTEALIYIFNEAGYTNNTGHKFPEMNEICSSKGDRPVVCCTDCKTGESRFQHCAVSPYGGLVSTEGSVATAKCYNFFKRLPYSCRSGGKVIMDKIWHAEEQCHTHEISRLEAALGGRDAQRWEFPHMALLGFGDEVSSAQWLCGGSIISERFILTAAHCSSSAVLGPVKFAALGLLRRSDPLDPNKVYKIKKIIVHPEYNPPSQYHDIALLETETEIYFGRDLLPACLRTGSAYSIAVAQAAGWGRLGRRRELADTLQVVILREFKESECAEEYRPNKRHLKNGYDHETQMCYGSHSTIVETCEGDSGGPLQTDSNKCLYTVQGVTSFGKGCGILGSAGVYTRVSYYVPWIESIVWPGETIIPNSDCNDCCNLDQ